MNEDCYSTACRHADGSVTEIRVHIRPEARGVAEEETGNAEEMIKRCVWRFIGVKQSEVKGESVEFTIDEQNIRQLLNDLRNIGLTNREVCRTLNKLEAKS